jgi:hypothetical protein
MCKYVITLINQFSISLRAYTTAHGQILKQEREHIQTEPNRTEQGTWAVRKFKSSDAPAICGEK